MIDEEKTFREKGYRSTDLKPQSHKEVWSICEGEDCQREECMGRWVQFRRYHALCHLCAVRTDEFREKQREFHNGRKQSENAKRKISVANKGKEISYETREKIRNSMKGKNTGERSEETKMKIRKSLEGVKRSKHSEDTKKKISESLKGMTRSKEHSANISKARKGKYVGESNHAWKGGLSSKDKKFRESFEYSNWRTYVFERDDYTCQECKQRGGVLNVHHILPYKDYKDTGVSLNVDNGITLCKKCHDETKGKEYEFVERYQKIVIEKHL